eukprot:1178674-Prorocentrum_minimum.AAC.2
MGVGWCIVQYPDLKQTERMQHIAALEQPIVSAAVPVSLNVALLLNLQWNESDEKKVSDAQRAAQTLEKEELKKVILKLPLPLL